MKRKVTYLQIIFVCLFILSLFIFTSCDESIASSNDSDNTVEKHTVIFDSQGGLNGPEKQEVENGKRAINPRKPTKTCYIFDGWYFDEERWDFKENVVTEDITLTAKWLLADEGVVYTLSEDENYYSVTSYTGGGGEVGIADSYKNLPVKTIGNAAFKNFRSISEILIPDSIVIIGDDAFYNCYCLNNLVIPKSVTTIGKNAFYGCYSIKKLEIPGNVENIGNSAFGNMQSLEDLKISNGVISIGEMAFCGLNLLKRIEIPKSVAFIGNRVFYCCTKLEEICVANGNAVYHSDQNCLIETETKKIISTCKNSVIPTDGSVTTIGPYAFELFPNKSIEISEKVTVIEQNAFSGSSFEEIKIPNSVITIESHAFSNCDSLLSIEIPNSISAIEESTFSSCQNLTTVKIPESVKSIGKYAFYNCSALKSVEIANGLNYIGPRAFIRCSSLESIDIPDSVKTLDDQAFFLCKNLKSVTIGKGMTDFGISVFQDCVNLIQINFNAVAMNEPIYLFTSFRNAGTEGEGITVTIGKDVTKIPSRLFDTNTSVELFPNVTNIIFETDSLCEVIGDKAFANCFNLKSVTFHNLVNSIQFGVFLNCTNLTEIVYKGTVEEWLAISKNNTWTDNSGEYVIMCSDGVISKDGTVTYN